MTRFVSRAARGLPKKIRTARLVKIWLILFFLLVIFDGAIRKWMLPELSTIVYLVKDLIIWGLFVWYSFRNDPIGFPNPIYKTWIPIFLSAYVFIVLLQAFNIRQPSLIVSAIGLKSHLAYIPLVVLIPHVISSYTDISVSNYIWIYSILILLPIFVLSIYQFSQPPSHWINSYLPGANINTAKVAGHARVTGTFSFISGYVKFLRFNAVLGFIIIIAAIKWGRGDILVPGMIITLGTLIVLPMTGSRSPLVVVGVGLTGLFMIMKGKKDWLVTAAVTCAVAVIAAAGLGDSILTQGWEAVGTRIEEAGFARDRLESFSTAPIQGVDEAGIFGYGVGFNHQASSRFIPVSNVEGRIRGDNRVLRVLVELGVVGFLILTALKLSILYLAVQTVRRSRNAAEFIIGSASFCIFLAHITLPVVYNAVSGVLYWGLAGMVLGVWCKQVNE